MKYKSLKRLRTEFNLLVFGICLVIWAIGCRSSSAPPDRKSATSLAGSYSQDFKSDIALVVIEWNSQPLYGGMGSGFLIDRERGVFYTNKHVSDLFDDLGGGNIKLFFNGRVYQAKVIKTLPLPDAALIGIDGMFDFSDFPQPLPLAQRRAEKGDKVRVEGFHLHSRDLREKHLADPQYDEKLVPIFKEYYGLSTRHPEKEREIVFEKIAGEIVAVEQKLKISGQTPTILAEARRSSISYFKIKTQKDHHFSFGGLSGTAVRNRKGETLGMVTLEEERLEKVAPELENPLGLTLHHKVFDTLWVTPIEAVENLRDYLKAGS